jgi:membrane protein YdbS with pleckstrin-like domain
MQPDREKLDPRYVTLMRQTGGLWSIGLSLFWGAIVAAVIRFSDLRDEFHAPLVILWVVLTIAHAWWGQVRPRLHYCHSSFQVDSEQIEIARGYLVRSIINIPRSRVQHTDVSQGPFERRHGLGTLHIYTAGVSHAMVPLPGLEHTRALAIRDQLLPRERPAAR